MTQLSQTEITRRMNFIQEFSNEARAAGLKHPHSADLAAYARRGCTVAFAIKDWGSDRLNRI